MFKTIGVIADTHGLLRPAAIEALQGVDAIIHAGDIGKEEIVHELVQIAPLTVIRGNIDTDAWAQTYPDTATLEILGHSIYIIHNLKDLDVSSEHRFSVVVSGHSHSPKNEVKDKTLYFNPGSAGPRRFKLPVTIGKLSVGEGKVSGEIIRLDI
ncbi:metallophosphoesterase family protein [Exilibacterium tricleocarpae]|uniref:Phosphoesterase n=1 Tax=Exilibacterium tricleocarpae TaxID=2591008 RepID=A0A545SSW3_9GAMM|nr:metallophosphoesterase family protein [Exilibacterium tricleocarpae]TQV68049.1 metallophosphoesterase family protein [Exilibacterium tricleocarpae]